MPDDTVSDGSPRAKDALLAALLLGIDPQGLGGVALRARAGPARDAWLALLRSLLPAGAPVRRLPPHIADDRLLGGLDLAATLRAGRPVAERGLLAEVDGGVLLIPLAERLSAAAAARIASAMDSGEVVLERDGLASRFSARFGVVAFDESIDGEEHPPAALLDRLAFHVELDGVRGAELAPQVAGDEVAMASERLPEVIAGDEAIEALCGAALALGIASLNAPILAVKAARALAALEGETHIGERHVAIAGRAGARAARHARPRAGGERS